MLDPVELEEPEPLVLDAGGLEEPVLPEVEPGLELVLAADGDDEDEPVEMELELEATEADVEELVEAHGLLELLEIGSGFLPGGPPCWFLQVTMSSPALELLPTSSL